jgi:hypothetical protein
MDRGFSVDFEITKPGEVTHKGVAELLPLDVVYYSFVGNLKISAGRHNLIFKGIPLVDTFLAIRRIIQIVPIYVSEAPYGQYFANSRTLFSVSGNELSIVHEGKFGTIYQKKPGVAERGDQSGSVIGTAVTGNYVSFCVVFGAATLRLLSGMELICPNIFGNETVRSKLSSLYEARYLVKGMDRVYSST